MSNPTPNAVVPGCLYLIATPVGNLSDISERALKVLREADFIAAEDTRVTAGLLNHFGISKPMTSYFQHNLRYRGEQILERIKAGESCALVSDAGTPAISDPGEDLVALCADAGITIYPVPGACAAVLGLIVSGLPTGRFTFEGFLSMNKAERSEHLNELKKERYTMIFYEAPHKLTRTLADMRDAFGGDRRIALCRELTKLHEETQRVSIDEAIQIYTERVPRGEYVLVIDGYKPETEKPYWAELTCAEHVAMLEEQGMGRMDAIKAAAKERSVGKSQIYNEIMR